MINGDFFSVAVPDLSGGARAAADVVVADGCSANTNYYTDGLSRGTCCCSCDKEIAVKAV
ncbi:MAG: hypothetical protein D6773_06255 [Alphaproteobacteria bacterium]|nr:MAG: hypothetical protein D6773_06255 [Alphaproteobacteria bacterium]